MGFEKFTKSVKNLVTKTPKTAKLTKVKAAPVEEVVREPWGTLERANGGTGGSVILHFGRETVSRYGLKPGDRVNMFFDADSHTIGVQVHPDGESVLGAHGNNERRLKVSVGRFFTRNLESYNLTLPYKTDVLPSPQPDRRRKDYLTFVMQVPAPVVKKARRKAPVAVAPAPTPVVKPRRREKATV